MKLKCESCGHKCAERYQHCETLALGMSRMFTARATRTLSAEKEIAMSELDTELKEIAERWTPRAADGVGVSDAEQDIPRLLDIVTELRAEQVVERRELTTMIESNGSLTTELLEARAEIADWDQRTVAALKLAEEKVAEIALLKAKDEWQPIENAPRVPLTAFGKHGYGPYIVAFPVQGEVARVRWWEFAQADESTHGNFIADGGNAAHPTHWKSLPPAPNQGEP